MGNNNKEIENLFEEIGKEISLSIIPLNKKKLIEKGKTWWEDNQSKIINNLCKNEKVKTVIDNIETKESEVIVVIADFISALVLGISPIIVATLITKIGLNNLCKEIWSKNYDS